MRQPRIHVAWHCSLWHSTSGRPKSPTTRLHKRGVERGSKGALVQQALLQVVALHAHALQLWQEGMSDKPNYGGATRRLHSECTAGLLC